MSTRRRIPALLLITASIAGGLVLAGPSTATSTRRTTSGGSPARIRTLFTSQYKIWAFAQDSGRIAWIGHLGKPGCGLHIRTIRSGRTASTLLVPAGCRAIERLDGLALANRTAAWIESHRCGNTECSWRIRSATAGDRRARVVDTVVDVRCERGICGATSPQPLLAGAGRLIVYSNGQGRVARIRGGRAGRLFKTSGYVYGLTVGDGRTAAVSLSLAPGDGCGCLDAPAWSPDGSRIAYLDGAVYRDNGGVTAAVAVMNADGSGRHPITPSQFMAGWPLSLSWSPDGTKIAYDGGSNPLGGQVSIANADGSGSSAVVQGYGPAWSPDGSKIAFIRIDATGETAGIFVTDPTGTNTQELKGGLAGLGNLAWSPDGSRIAFSLNGVLQLMDADGSNVHSLGATGVEPSWSPDGSQIVFQTTNGLALVRADGTALRRITSGPDEHPSWSPDGKTIVFASNRNDPYFDTGIYNDRAYLELYLVAPDGSNLRPLSFTKPAGWENEVSVRSIGGRAVSTLPGLPALPGNVTAETSASFAEHIAAVSGIAAGGAARITLFEARTGAELATVQVGKSKDSFVSRDFFSAAGGDAHWVVFHLGTKIAALDPRTHRIIRLAKAASTPLGLSVSGRRVAWAENISRGKGFAGRIRTLRLPS